MLQKTKRSDISQFCSDLSFYLISVIHISILFSEYICINNIRIYRGIKMVYVYIQYITLRKGLPHPHHTYIYYSSRRISRSVSCRRITNYCLVFIFLKFKDFRQTVSRILKTNFKKGTFTRPAEIRQFQQPRIVPRYTLKNNGSSTECCEIVNIRRKTGRTSV